MDLWPHTIHRHLKWYWKGRGRQKNTQAIVNDLTGLGRGRSSSRVGKERHRTPCRQHREQENHLRGSQMTSTWLPTEQRRAIEREAHRTGWQRQNGASLKMGTNSVVLQRVCSATNQCCYYHLIKGWHPGCCLPTTCTKASPVLLPPRSLC